MKKLPDQTLEEALDAMTGVARNSMHLPLQDFARELLATLDNGQRSDEQREGMMAVTLALALRRLAMVEGEVVP